MTPLLRTLVAAAGGRRVRMGGDLPRASSAFTRIVSSSALLLVPLSVAACAGGAAPAPLSPVVLEGRAFHASGAGEAEARAEIEVNAPIDRVQRAVLSIAECQDDASICGRCTPLGATARGGRDAYVEIALPGGEAHLFVRINGPSAARIDGEERYDLRLLDGNVRDFHVRFRLKALGERHTRLRIEASLQPGTGFTEAALGRLRLLHAEATAVMLKSRAELGAGASP